MYLSCINLKTNWYYQYIMFGLLWKLHASLVRKKIPKPPSDIPLHSLSKSCYVPVGFIPSPSLESIYCFICRRQSLAVLTDIWWFALFLDVQSAKSGIHDKIVTKVFSSWSWEYESPEWNGARCPEGCASLVSMYHLSQTLLQFVTRSSYVWRLWFGEKSDWLRVSMYMVNLQNII